MPPDPERLQRYLLGTLEQDELPAVEAFVRESPTVVSTLGELPTSTDPLLEAVRAARQCPPPAAETRRLADRLKRLPHEHPEATTTTVGHAAGADQPLDWSTYLAPPEADSELGRLGPYRVFRVLGEGGMGVVFEAEDTLLCRRVALKVVSPTIARSPVAKERFLREARAVAAVEHDNIIAIYQVGEDRGLPFLAMPLLQGETLADRLKREGRLPPAEVLRIGDEVAAGLSAAHARGLVHRDIKPANLWLDQRSGRVKILDFGLARETLALDGPGLTQSGTIVGTPYYMSPEQAEGQAVDPRSDLFSLGSVLYVAATGELPFPGSTPLRVLSALANRTPPRTDAVVPGFPFETSDLIARLMSKTPNERPASAVEVAREFTMLRQRPSTQDRPILPGPSKIIEPQPRRSRFLGLLTALALLLGFGWMYGAAIVLVVTNQGELTIEVDDPNVEVTIRQNDAELHQKSTQRRFRVRPVNGEVEFHDPETGAVALTKRFELKRAGEHASVSVTARELSAPAPPAPSTAAAEQTPAEPPRVAAEPSSPAATTPAETRGGSESATGVANDGGLEFDDPYGRIDIPLQLPVNTPLTVEFDVTHAESDAIPVQNFLFQHPRNLDLKVQGDRVVLTTGPWPDVRGHFYKVDVAQAGRRRQLAATVSGESLRLFVDGRLVEWKHNLKPETLTTPAPIYLGRPYGGGSNHPFNGLVHRVRISAGERYSKRYKPEDEWTQDATTLVLYDFRSVDPTKGPTPAATITTLLKTPPYPTSPDDLPADFTPLFNGKDLTGWKAAVEDPKKRAEMPADELAKIQVKADQQLSSHWRVANGVLSCDGHGHNLSTVREDYTDFELYLEWKIGPGGDSGVYLRGAPQVQICDSATAIWGKDEGSGGLFNNKQHTKKPLVNADKPVGEWNAMFIRMVGEKVTVSLNGKLVVDDVVYENFVSPDHPIYSAGPLELQRYGQPVEFRNIRIRDLTSSEPQPGKTGTVVQDLSGKGNHGKIVSSKWVPPQTVSTSPAVTPWTLRSMAEWTIQHGGRVLLGDGRPVAILEELPAEVTRVDVIDFSDVSSFGDAEAAVVGGWPKIKGINVSGTSITDAGLRRLAALPLGNSLSVNLTGITGEGFEPFAEKDLGTLTAYRCRFSPAGWQHLAKVGRTVQWSCNHSNLADADLTAIIARHPEITKLHANRTALTDIGGVELAQLVQLEELWLDETAVSDATLERLGTLKNLIRLDVRNTKVTAGGVATLQQALPSCAIHWK